MENNHSKEFEMHGCIQVPMGVSEDEFDDKFIGFIEENGWFFGGGIREIIDGYYINQNGEKSEPVWEEYRDPYRSVIVTDLQVESFLRAEPCGWARFFLGAFSASVSEVSCFPMDCVNAFIAALQGKLPAAVSFDEEGRDFTLLLDVYDHISIVSYGEGQTRLYSYSISHCALASAFLNDMV